MNVVFSLLINSILFGFIGYHFGLLEKRVISLEKEREQRILEESQRVLSEAIYSKLGV